MLNIFISIYLSVARSIFSLEGYLPSEGILISEINEKNYIHAKNRRTIIYIRGRLSVLLINLSFFYKLQDRGRQIEIYFFHGTDTINYSSYKNPLFDTYFELFHKRVRKSVRLRTSVKVSG